MNFPRRKSKTRNSPASRTAAEAEVVEARQMLSGTVPIYVLGSNGNLWYESSNWQTAGRIQIDSNVKSFVPTVGGDLYVLGTNGNLWLEGATGRKSGRTFIDSDVQAFATVLAATPTSRPVPGTFTCRRPTAIPGRRALAGRQARAGAS